VVLQFNATQEKKRKRKFVISLYAYASIINATSYLSKRTTAVNSSHLIISAESGKRKKKREKIPVCPPTHPFRYPKPEDLMNSRKSRKM